jgi:antitoxin VapB
VRDPKTDNLVRELARRRGCGLTEVVKLAVTAELRREDDRIPLRERLRPVQEAFRSVARTGLPADKAFYDGLQR